MSKKALEAANRWLLPALLKTTGMGLSRRGRFLAWQRQMILDAVGVETILDVGGNVGQYATQSRRFGFRGEIHSFEPGAALADRLRENSKRDSRWFVHELALGVRSEETVLHVWDGSASTSCSLLTPRRELTSLIGAPREEQVRVASLDEWVGDMPAISLDRTLLKVDVQGGEKAVLDGAGQSLNALAAVELELPLRVWYAGESRIEVMLGLMRDRGFVVSSIATERFNESWLGAVDVDVLFIRRELSRVPAGD